MPRGKVDSNFPGGESIIRQLMWGQKWYRENLGEDPQVAWLTRVTQDMAALKEQLRREVYGLRRATAWCWSIPCPGRARNGSNCPTAGSCTHRFPRTA